MRRLWLNTAVLALALHLAGSAFAATYYVDAKAADDSGSGDQSRPKKFITSGLRLLSPGDTLVIEDGVYEGALNHLSMRSPRAFPPSGLDRDHPTTVKARNVGGVIIDGLYAEIPFDNTGQTPAASYLHIDGIHFRHGNGGVFAIKGHHHRVTNCGFEDGQAPTDSGQKPIAYIVGSDSSYVLFEDCWAWGKGRYGIYFGGASPGAHHSIFRRVVVRQDDAAHGPVGGIMFYNGHDNVCQNCIVVDGTDRSTSEHYGAFSATANYPPNDPSTLDNSVVGSIALNNATLHGYQPQYNIGTLTLKDCVLWGNGKDGVTMSANAIGATVVDHCTIGSNGRDGIGNNPSYTKSALSVSDTVSLNNGRYGLYSVRSAQRVGSHGNRSGDLVGTKVSQGVSLKSRPAPLKYLTRVENPLKGAGTDGTDVGANVLYRIGGEGAFYGEPGWDAVTPVPLWPLPNEEIWAAKIRSYASSGPGGNRGFASLTGKTPLTDYIWGYLGAPVPPFHLAVAPSEGGTVVTWDPATASAGYKLYVGTASGRYDLAGYQKGKALGNVTSAQVTGLAAGKTYYFAVTAVDAANKESGFSYEVTLPVP